MKRFQHHDYRYLIGFFILVVAIFALLRAAEWQPVHIRTAEAKMTREHLPLDRTHPQLQKLIEILHRHNHKLMASPDVVGTATGLDDSGRPAALVFSKAGKKEGLPDAVEGFPVVMKLTGEIFAMKPLPIRTKTPVPTSRFSRPVPIGVSTGNRGECSAGTIAARVKDSSGNVYALSNNHVYALENNADQGEIYQPGLYDTRCVNRASNRIGTLFSFVPIDFSRSGNNVVDAAIASSDVETLGNGTPSNGYGTPSSAILEAAVNQSVQKYGRTTSLTRGTVVGINATVTIRYDSGSARFTDQIVVSSSRPFIKSGDSGSLLVTDPGANPVGLLFAGNASGNYAWANPIDEVLKSFDVTIDGD
jgi:hypothetical protein